MSDSVDIFIGYPSSLKDLAQELEPLLEMRLTFVPAKDETYSDLYQGYTEEIAIDVVDADGFVNDKDLHFENYQYLVGISSIGFADWQEKAEVRDAFAQGLFEKLKATRRYPLL